MVVLVVIVVLVVVGGGGGIFGSGLVVYRCCKCWEVLTVGIGGCPRVVIIITG